MDNEKFPKFRVPFSTPSYISRKEFKKDISSNLLNHYIYIWLKTGEEHWMFPIMMNNNHLIGYISLHEDYWQLRQIPLNLIDSIH